MTQPLGETAYDHLFSSGPVDVVPLVQHVLHLYDHDMHSAMDGLYNAYHHWLATSKKDTRIAEHNLRWLCHVADQCLGSDDPAVIRHALRTNRDAEPSYGPVIGFYDETTLRYSNQLPID